VGGGRRTESPGAITVSETGLGGALRQCGGLVVALFFKKRRTACHVLGLTGSQGSGRRGVPPRRERKKCCRSIRRRAAGQGASRVVMAGDGVGVGACLRRGAGGGGGGGGGVGCGVDLTNFLFADSAFLVNKDWSEGKNNNKGKEDQWGAAPRELMSPRKPQLYRTTKRRYPRQGRERSQRGETAGQKAEFSLNKKPSVKKGEINVNLGPWKH